jgi:hypothetical protein
MTNTYTISTTYDSETDLIRAYIESADSVEAEIEFNAELSEVRLDLLHNDLSKFAVVNAFDFIFQVMKALLDATDDETEIPMHIEHDLKITL